MKLSDIENLTYFFVQDAGRPYDNRTAWKFSSTAPFVRGYRRTHTLWTNLFYWANAYPFPWYSTLESSLFSFTGLHLKDKLSEEVLHSLIF